MTTEGVNALRALAEDDRVEAEFFEFYALCAEGSWPSSDPDFVPSPEKAAENRAAAAIELAHAGVWDSLADKAEAQAAAGG